MATTPGYAPAAGAAAGTGSRRRAEQVLGRDWRAAWLFYAPTLILLFALVAWPFVQGVYMSFTKTVGSALTIGPFIGLQNYVDLVQERDFRESLWITIKFTFFSEIFKPLLGVIAALLIQNFRRVRTIISALILLPWIVPTIIEAIIWRALYNPIFGGLNYLLMGLHLIDQPIVWLGDPKTALYGVVLVNIWAGIPFFTITNLAGLKSIEPELYDAAAVDGANAWQRFRYITLPMLTPTTFFVSIMLTIACFKVFDLILVMTGGGPGRATNVLVVHIYNTAFKEFRYGYSSAIAMALFVIVLIITIVQFRMERRWVNYM
jgi:multiple sugar transport system permease protein